MLLFQKVDPEEARRAASDILSERRFRAAPLPRPLRPILEQLGEWLRPIVEALTSVFRTMAGWLPGEDATLWTVLAVAMVAAAAAVAARLGTLRATAARESRPPRSRGGRDLEKLERAAEEAERAGEFSRAIRLRFTAGLLRLDAARVIEFKDSITSGEVARVLRSPNFDGLAASFDRVAYGGLVADSADAARTREGWNRVLEQVRAA